MGKLIKRIDNLGRMVIPKGYRVMLGLEPGDPLDVEVKGGSLLITPHRDGCAFCGAGVVAVNYLKRNICPECVSSIRAITDA